MKSSFQTMLSAIKNNGLTLPMPSSIIMFFCLFLTFHLWTNAYICVHICEELFSKTWSPNMALPLPPQFLDWRLTRLRKELFPCIYIDLHINKHICIIYLNQMLDKSIYIYVYIYIHMYGLGDTHIYRYMYISCK